MAIVKEISIFVDESGSFSPFDSDPNSPYYILCMVFHDQADDIFQEIEKLREAFRQTGLDADHTVHGCFKLFKPYNSGNEAIHDTLLQEIVDFLISHRDDFNASERIKVYYDDGQAQVTALLKEAFAIYSAKVEFATDVQPSRYRLFQAADVICTLELAKAKLLAFGSISESEERFFGGVKNFKKNYLKPLSRKEYR